MARMMRSNFVRPASNRYCWCDDCGGPNAKGRSREKAEWQREEEDGYDEFERERQEHLDEH